MLELSVLSAPPLQYAIMCVVCLLLSVARYTTTLAIG